MARTRPTIALIRCREFGTLGDANARDR